MTEERENDQQSLSPVEAFSSAVDHDDLARLMAALRDHDRARAPRRAGD